MENKPLVSVLMTAYNREKYISEAIESVQASTYSKFELIIVDDCSTDDTVNIARSYALKDSRIKIHENEKNLGDYPNRNKAASFVSGKFIKYVDSDDYISPDGLMNMVESMEKFPGAGFGISSSFIDHEIRYPVELKSREAYCYHYFNKPVFFASPGEAIFTKEAFNKIGGFNEKRMISDFDMWHKIALQYPMVLMAPGFVNIRQHPGREMTDQKRYVLQYESIKLKYLSGNSCPLDKIQVNTIKKKRRNTVLKIFLKKLVRLDFEEAIPRLKIFFFYLHN